MCAGGCPASAAQLTCLRVLSLVSTSKPRPPTTRHIPTHSQEAPRKRKSLEQRRAVVLEKPEKRAAALLQQLNAIRNAKAGKRREQAARKRAVREKAVAKEEEWRGK